MPNLLTLLRSAGDLHVAQWRAQYLPILQTALVREATRGYWRCLVLLEARYIDAVIVFLQREGFDDLCRTQQVHSGEGDEGICGCRDGTDCPVLALGPVPVANCAQCGEAVHRLDIAGRIAGLMVGWDRDGRPG